MQTLIIAMTLGLQATSPPGPTVVELIDPTRVSGQPVKTVNPVDSGDHVAIRWEHTCTTCDFILRLDGTVLTTAESAGITTYTHDLGVLEAGVHVIEVEASDGSPCPPATEQPMGCSRFLKVTVMDDGTVVSGPEPVDHLVAQEGH